jgi:serine protease Do
LNFAIPSNILKKVINQLRDYGTIHRSWIGISVSPITKNVANALGISKQQSGAVITRVENNSPASIAGVQIGDILLSINDERISSEASVEYILNNLPIGKVIPIQIMRHMIEMKLSVKVGFRNEEDFSFNSGGNAAVSQHVSCEKIDGIDIGVTDLTADLRKTFEIPDNINGVLVSNISDSSNTDISVGDVIVTVNQKAITSVADLRIELQKLSKNEGIKKRGEIAFYIFDPQVKRYDYIAVDFYNGATEKTTEKQVVENTNKDKLKHKSTAKDLYESFKSSLKLK